MTRAIIKEKTAERQGKILSLNTLDYKLIRSKRKSISLSVKEDGSLQVRAPHSTPRSTIDAFVEKKHDWVTRVREKYERQHILTVKDDMELKELNQLTTDKIKFFMKAYTGRQPTGFRIKPLKSSWGNCNSKGVITINSFVGMLPDRLFDYILYHELCHLYAMAHNEYFWNLVSYHVPDWKILRKELRSYRIVI